MEVFIRRWLLSFFFIVQVCDTQALSRVYFTPQDNITSIFIDMIDAETKSIHGAIYMFTDKKIAQALVQAKNRGVDVQIILDQISMATCGKGKFLQEHGVHVLVHRTQEFNPYTMALMHHKFFIFESNVDKKTLVWTGSWNCTLRATQHNDENVIVLDDEHVVTMYQDTFKKLQERLLA